MWTSWSRGQATPNEVDNNSKSWKSGLIEPWTKGNLVSKNQSIGKRLGSRDKVSKNPKYMNDAIKPVNFL
jgi:hypothetical protein